MANLNDTIKGQSMNTLLNSSEMLLHQLLGDMAFLDIFLFICYISHHKTRFSVYLLNDAF